MGSHGGASAAGQRRTLDALGLNEESLGCPIDARMETVVLERDGGPDAHLATAVAEADAFLVVNRGNRTRTSLGTSRAASAR
nr:hypothetical protein [Halogeometricum sp. CBA1124]